MLSCGPLTQQGALYPIARHGQFMPLESPIAQTSLLALLAFVGGQGFSCQMDRFPDVPGKRSLEEGNLCAVRGT